MSPGSLSFAKLVMISSAPAKSAGEARYVSKIYSIHSINVVPYNLDSNLYNLGVRSFYLKCNKQCNENKNGYSTLSTKISTSS